MNDQISSWRMIKVFFQAFHFYRNLENNFNDKVRASISKKPSNASNLYDSFLDYLEPKNLDLLRDTYLVDLRHLSHAEFRGRKKMDRFDIYISEIFHEVSILKEQKFILDHYSQRQDQISQESLQQMLGQTYTLFETKIEHVGVLFNNAKSRLEEILPTYQKNDFILRNLYLEGSTLFKHFYDAPVKNLLDIMFVDGGFSIGMLAIASSFSLGGFFDQANKVILALKKEDLKRLNPELLSLYKKIKLFLKDHQNMDNLAIAYQSFLTNIKPELINLKLN